MNAPRAMRGKVLLVGLADGSEAARAWAAAEPVADRHEALARVIASSAREPVLAAIFAASELANDAAMVRECFERVDPSIELMVHSSGGAVPAGFLGVDGPTEALRASVLKALGVPVEESPPPPPSPEPPTMKTLPLATEPVQTPSVEAAPAEVTRESAADHPTPSIETFEPASERPLGDLDLVRAVLEGEGRLRDLALTLLRQRLGAADLALRPADSKLGSRDRGSVEVRTTDGNRLGWLVSGNVPAAALAPWAEWLATWLELDRRHDELAVQALTDDLTGVGNRRAFETVLSQTLADARPKRRPVTLMVFDIDNFKTYNDRFGHEAGDEVLRETVQLLRSTIRRGDHVFRIGGDEFVVIFSDPDGPRKAGTSPPDAVDQIVRRFQAQVLRMRLPQLGLEAPGTVTVSAGLATYPWDGLDPGSLLAHADQLALQSKRSGKNLLTLGPGAREHLEGK